MNRNHQHRMANRPSMGGVDVIVLAAGRSSRLGQPKALVDVDGRPLIAHLIQRLQRINDVEITIVTNNDILADVYHACPETNVVLNPDPEKGRTGSIQCGLTSILERKGRLPKLVLIVPVDRPGWSVDIAMHLIASSATSSPVWDGRGGHPLMIAGDDVNTVYLADSNAPLSSLIERDKLDVEFPFLHLNIDTEDDLHELDLAAKEDWF